jgi:hypothetical protein
MPHCNHRDEMRGRDGVRGRRDRERRLRRVGKGGGKDVVGVDTHNTSYTHINLVEYGTDTVRINMYVRVDVGEALILLST